MADDEGQQSNNIFAEWYSLKQEAKKLFKYRNQKTAAGQRYTVVCKRLAAIETGHGADDLYRQARRLEGIGASSPDGQPAPAGPAVKLFGRMFARSQYLRHELSFRLWACLRWAAVQTDNRHSIPLEDVKQLFADDGEYGFSSWANLRKQIHQAEERGYLQYSKDGRRLFYASERRVAVEILGLESVGGWAIVVPLNELTGDFMAIRSLFYRAFHAGRGDGYNRPISRQSVRRETGRGKRTQRKYEHLNGEKMGSKPTYELLRKYTPKTYAVAKTVERKNYDDRRPHRVMSVYNAKSKRRKKYIVKQLPNTYRADLPTVKRGRRWLNYRVKHLRNILQGDGLTAVSLAGSFDSEIQQRRYYWTRGAVPQESDGYFYRPSFSSKRADYYTRAWQC